MVLEVSYDAPRNQAAIELMNIDKEFLVLF